MLITSAKAQTSYYGNQYRVISGYGAGDSEAGDIIDAGDKCSMRFTAQNTETAVTKVGVRVDETATATFRFGLQGSNPETGNPSGTWLGDNYQAYGDVAPDAPGILEITLNESASLTAGTVYHLVAEPAGDPGAEHLTLGCVNPSNQLYPYDSSSDTNANTLDYNISHTDAWTVRERSPFYLLFNASGFYEGNPYYTFASDDVFGTEYCGERFTVSGGNKHITTIGTVVRQYDTDEPADSLYYHLYDVTTETIFIVSGTLCTGADIEPDTTYVWQDATLGATQTLTDGNTYSLYFTSPDSVIGANYEIDQVKGYAGGTKTQSYGGATNAYYIYTTDGSPWDLYDYHDIPFRFTLGEGVVKIIIRKWRELYH